MRVLYHWPLDPGSRQARIALAETKLKFKLEPVNPWAPDATFASVCAEGVPPCLIDVISGGKVTISGARAICEYLAETSKKTSLLPDSATDRAEMRRLCDWMANKFTDDVQAYIMHERVEKTLLGNEAPHPPTLREGREHLQFHLDYFSWLLERRDYLAGHRFSLADIACFAHLSCLDFVGEIRWRDNPTLKDWYQKIKSRPSVQPLLGDRVGGMIPPRHYRDLDF
ncbi:glutathione S-transferase family protein [Fretibacter rubidus]|uniref:glutathione S-transferase family protein n=1 Tax=Fretibacter rubidus TaxID=570162 RepID=UPI00352A690A